MDDEDSKEHLNTECAYIIDDKPDHTEHKEDVDDGMESIITTQECTDLTYVQDSLHFIQHQAITLCPYQ